MSKAMLKIELKREDDGRWLGEVSKLPGVMAYGATELDARKKTAALAFHVIAERIEHDEPARINCVTEKESSMRLANSVGLIERPRIEGNR